MAKKKICHVCGKEKKPYLLVMDNSVFSFLQYEHAREDGPICQRCDQYFAMTGDKKEPTKEEFKIAEKAAEFARMMHRWWMKNKPQNYEDDEEKNSRDWEGTTSIADWYRKEMGEDKNGKK